MPFIVRTVVGNQTARAIRKALAETVPGKLTSTSGIQAVDGIGPSILTRGWIQYRIRWLKPIAIPVPIPARAPKNQPVRFRR